ncbi:CoxG family protein [Nocardioides sp.]|uniref:CoxG family protein n=1 Tax=Nocardioides sp. TaxID=35761 RepID=UPI002D804D5B|nr:SRPBCC family protein [Nocardioides sp.]HET8961837.1 SRPBCC family protein [Nocardioides sp.]
MATFTAGDRSTEVVAADRKALWAALTDPDLLPRLTPYLHSIDVDGDRWRWNMARIPVLGISVAPSFTEQMTFDEPRRITFTHDPRSEHEKAGVEGSYQLEEAEGGTRLSMQVDICVDLPLPGAARAAVQGAMRGVMAVMGRRFAANLLRHLSDG